MVILTHKKHTGSHTIKIMLFCIVMLMSISLISAFEFDNIQNIKETIGKAGYKDIEIKNAFGLGETLWSGTLDSNTNTCGINCEAIQTITLHEDGSLIDDVIFKTLKEDESWKEESIISYNLQIKIGEESYEVDDYESQCSKLLHINGSMYQSCEQVQTGSHTEYNYEWEDYIIGTELEAGIYEVKLSGKKKMSRTVDWIYKTQGETLNEWATWEGSNLGVGLISYYKLDDNLATTNVIDIGGTNNGTASANTNTLDATGILGTAFDFNNAEEVDLNAVVLPLTGPLTFNHWVKFSTTGSQISIEQNNGGAGRLIFYPYRDGKIALQVDTDRIIDYTIDISNNDWHMLTIRRNSTDDWSLWMNGVHTISANENAALENTPTFISDDGAEDMEGLIDEVGFWNIALTAQQIEDLWNGSTGLNFVGEGFGVTLNSPDDLDSLSANNIDFNGTAIIFGGDSLVNMSLWHNGTGTWERNQTELLTGTINSTIFNSDFIDGTYLWNIESCNDNGECVFAPANRTFTVDTTFPKITINNPTSIVDFGILGRNETLNWSVSDVDLDSVWFGYNGTNTSLFGASNTTKFLLTNTPHNLTFWANDSLGNTNSSFISWNYSLFQTAESFVTSTVSGAVNPFTLNITTNGTPITIVYLNYNGTTSLASISSSGNDFIITKNQISPVVSVSKEVPFFWNITQQGGGTKLTDTQNQTVDPIQINKTCGAGSSVIYNFTISDEITQAKLVGATENTSVKIDLDLYTSDRALKLLDSFNEYSELNSAAICINNNLSGGEQYNLDLQVQYGATAYSSEFYNIERATLNSSTLSQNITLYDLPTANTQKFKLRVRDTSFLPIDGALIKIQRKYIENGTFFTTEIPKADEGGISSASLQVNDIIYNFFIFDAGELIASFTNVRAVCQTPLVSQCEIDFNAFQSEITIPNFEEGDDFNFTLGFNETSRLVSTQFIIPSGEPSTVQLIVIREDTLGTAVCSDTLTSSAGTLTCTVPASFGNATVLAKLFKDDEEQGKGNIKLDQKSSDIFAGVLVFLSVLVMMTLVGVGVSDNPVVTGVFLFVGVILLFGINLVNNTGFIGATATILFFAIAIILVIIKAARRS